MDDDFEFFLLPELLQMILTKAILIQKYSKDTAKCKGDETIFVDLASVDFRWWSSMKKYYLKYQVRHLSKAYFKRAKMRSTIIRNNLNFLKEVIDPDKIIPSLESCGCLTEDQVTSLTQLRTHKDKNHEILFMLQDFSSQKYSKFVDYLFLTNQAPAALVLERGGEAVKVHINNGKTTWTREFEMELIERFQRMQTENTLIFNDLLNASDEKRLNDVFILDAKQNKGIELWFWCKTKRSLNQLNGLNDDNLREIIQRMYRRLIPEYSASLGPRFIQVNYSLVNDFAERRLCIRHVKDHDNLPGFGFFRDFGFSPCVTSFQAKYLSFMEIEITAYNSQHLHQSLKSIEFSFFRCLPQDLLTVILTNAALVQMYFGNDARRKGTKFIFCGLASVDLCWWNLMKTSNFKNKFRLLRKVYIQRAEMRSMIIRNNLNFLKEVIDPDKIIFPLKSCGCLTEGQVTFLSLLRNIKEKNRNLLLLMLEDFSFQKYSKFIDCLFATNQIPAALVLERGGAAVKVHINNRKAKWAKEYEMELIKRFRRTEDTLMLNDFQNAAVEKRLNDVCILHAKQNKGIEMWFWCKTKHSLDHLKALCESDKALREIIQRMYQRLIPEHSTVLEPQLIQMDSTFPDAFAERQLSTRHMEYRDNLTVCEFSKCVTSFKDKIYIAQESSLFVCNNKFPYECLGPMVLCHQSGLPNSIASCSINKCLYVSANVTIYKVEPEFGDRVSVWLDTLAFLFIISVTSRGDVLVLTIEGEDIELLIFTSEGIVKRAISMEDHFIRTRFIQEIMPDIVAVSYSNPRVTSFADNFSFIVIMRLDDNGTMLRNFGFQQEIVGLSCIRFCGLLTAVFLSDWRAKNSRMLRLQDKSFGFVQLNHWPLESEVIGNLLRTEERIYSIHFAADQKQLYVLSSFKLHVYQLNYEDEDYD